jgi:hypothetical protein
MLFSLRAKGCQTMDETAIIQPNQLRCDLRSRCSTLEPQHRVSGICHRNPRQQILQSLPVFLHFLAACASCVRALVERSLCAPIYANTTRVLPFRGMEQKCSLMRLVLHFCPTVKTDWVAG